MDETLSLLKAAKEGDDKARKKLMEDNLRLVWSVARRFMNRGQELEDLFQIGCIGLLKAIDHFDIERPVKLSTYAVPLIMGEIKRFLRDDGMIKVSRTMKENAYKIGIAQKYIQHQYGRDATIEEIAATTELTVEEVTMAVEANSFVDSIDRMMYEQEGDGVALSERLHDEKSMQTETENRIYIEHMLQRLEELERKVITYRYYEDKTQADIGKLLGISQVQVSRLEKRALKKMRDY